MATVQGHTPSYPIDIPWYMDSGATDHLISQMHKLNAQEKYQGSDKVHTANGAGMHISHIGQASVPTHTSKQLRLTNILHVPSVTRDLLSVHKFTWDNNVFCEFHPFDLFVKDRDTRDVLLRGCYRHGLYELDAPSSTPQVFSGVRTASSQWHSRLGHPATPIVRHVLHRYELPVHSSSQSDTVCDACQQGKSHQLPFSESSRVVKSPLELVFSDVWGHTQTSLSGHNYYVSFIDAYSRFTWLYLINHKSDVFNVFLQFQAHVERLLKTKIISVQSDWSGEYHNLNTFFQKLGISHRVSCPHTHQQNGVAERKHRHIVETGLTLLAHACVPFCYWSDAFTTACFLLNRLPTLLLHMKTPLELLLHETPDYTFLKVFGCACWPHTRPYNNNKLEFWSKSACFLGIVLFIKATSASMFLRIVCLYLAMLFLMRLFSRFWHFRLLPHHPHNNLHMFCLINLKMLHTLLCCCLTMVQVLNVELAYNWLILLTFRIHPLLDLSHPRLLILLLLPRVLQARCALCWMAIGRH
jgi:histone deacetylase 1/2